MPQIRTLTPADYEAVAAISAQAMTEALVGLPNWETSADVARTVSATRRGAFVVAAEESGHIVGVAGYDLAPDGEAILYGPLVVTRGHGTGAWLAAKVEALARQDGASVTAMLIGLHNKGGAAWAQWRGYQPDTEYPELLMTFAYPASATLPAPTDSALVRPARPEDLNRVYDLYTTCFSPDAMTAQDVQGFLGECVVFEHEGRVAGVVRVDDRAYVHNLCIDPALRRRGFGRGLLAGALRRYWASTPARVSTTIRLENAAAAALLRSMGFTREVPVGKWVRREA